MTTSIQTGSVWPCKAEKGYRNDLFLGFLVFTRTPVGVVRKTGYNYNSVYHKLKYSEDHSVLPCTHQKANENCDFHCLLSGFSAEN